jgi:hypothetical protein
MVVFLAILIAATNCLCFNKNAKNGMKFMLKPSLLKNQQSFGYIKLEARELCQIFTLVPQAFCIFL